MISLREKQMRKKQRGLKQYLWTGSVLIDGLLEHPALTKCTNGATLSRAYGKFICVRSKSQRSVLA